MSDVTKKLAKLLEDWLIDPTQVDTLAFTFKRGRVDGNFLEVEIYFPDPESDLSGDPEWAMVPVMKAMRPETKFDGEDWDIALMNEADLMDFEKIFDKSNASS